MAYTASRSAKSKLLMRAGVLALITAGVCANAYAQQAEQKIEFDIPSQSLENALKSYGVATDRQVMFATDIVEGKTAKAITGQLAPGEALGQLLDGTGLVYETTTSNVILVKTLQDQVMNSAAGGAVAVAASAQESFATGPSGEGEAVAVSGRVTDVTTGANLKGALVILEPTGETTSTDDLGRYRFSSVAPGTYTIRVSYLGYEGRQENVRIRSGQNVAQDFALGGDAEALDTIIVYGSRSARAQSLNQERTAANSTTVLSADMLGNFNGTTISEALRRAPGVAFEQDPNTGDGANVILRGLEPDLNQIQLNGLRVLDGSGVGRSADLSGILTESIESVTINKSLLPSQDSNGAGGLVEIETKAPLDRDRRFASFGVEYGRNGNDFGDEIGFNGTVSGTFGASDSFGASVSVSYREEERTRINYSVSNLQLGQYLPLDEDGAPILFDFFVDPLRAFPFEPGVDEVYPGVVTASQGDTETELFSVTGALQKQFGAHTDWRLDVTYTGRKNANYEATTSTEPFPRYDLAPIEELSGEIRAALVSEDVFGGAIPFFGAEIPGTVRRSARYSPDQDSDTIGISFRGNSVIDQWSFGYQAGYTRSTNSSAEAYSITLGSQSVGPGVLGELITRDLLLPRALENVTGDGRLVSVFDSLASNESGFILPLFNEAGFAFYNDIDSLALRSVSESVPAEGESDALTLATNAKYSFDNRFLKYIDAGLNFQDTSFTSVRPGSNAFDLADPSTLLSSLGLAFGPGLLTQVGAQGDFDSLSRGSVEAFAADFDQFVNNGDLVIAFPNTRDEQSRTSSTSERALAGYLESQFNFGKLEIIGGVRVEQLDLESTFFAAPTVFDENAQFLPQPGEILTASVSQTDILPRILVNYRLAENMLFRAGYYTTVSRPQIRNLTDRSAFFLDIRPEPNTLRVTQGNPELEPAVTHNFSLDGEWYSDNVGVLKLGLFYKLITNPLQQTAIATGIEGLPEDVVLPDNPFFEDLGPDTEVTLTQPINGETNDKIWGLELTGERQFTFLPGLWGGFGVLANYTYTDSASVRRLVTQSVPEGFVDLEGVPFDGSPRHSGTIGLTYNKYNLDASLFYSAQARRLTSFNSFFVHDYAEAFESLDFRADYYLDVAGVTTRLFLRGENLLESGNDPRLQTSAGGDTGVPRYFTGATFFGGRSFFVGATATF